MTRRNFYEIINESSFNFKAEYNRIYSLFYDGNGYGCSVCAIVDEHFDAFPSDLIGRVQSLTDFDETYGFDFPKNPFNVTSDELISMCEYMFNLGSWAIKYAEGLMDYSDYEYTKYFLNLVSSCIKDLYHTRVERNGFIIFVPEKQEVIATAEIVEKEVALSILEYHHYSIRGNLSKKKGILKLMADDIEPQRKVLNGINKSFTDILFQMLNKFVRHNNNDNEYISTLSPKELETCYDDIYQMWLLAKLEIDNIERKKRAEETLKQINA